jgi:hypothetical protein
MDGREVVRRAGAGEFQPLFITPRVGTSGGLL